MAATKRELAKAVLAEIPDQLVGFMRSQNILPGQFKKCASGEEDSDAGAQPETLNTPGPFATSNRHISSTSNSSCSDAWPQSSKSRPQQAITTR
ncbi:hypothetical protein Ciccas_006280 [Cichlidogyrus casuarinus]|uniref:Uncharacterized protein n=1 Tax=Cichlidogyrus casuarinus TaxID=1844966 RepID=A0ABD2Q7D3_9PLAT